MTQVVMKIAAARTSQTRHACIRMAYVVIHNYIHSMLYNYAIKEIAGRTSRRLNVLEEKMFGDPVYLLQCFLQNHDL